ncbi:MAG: AAA family ATPase, partial [Nitrospirales bacterium]
IGETRTRHDKEAKRIRSQTEQLRVYVRSKADRLFQLEFITQPQRDALFPNNLSEPDDEKKDWPRLDEIGNGAAGAINHIQRYLYRGGIRYPRALLANFFALLQTGDLIILSGLSGSGKTNLVKSFANATGNVAHVIPVKPNWTSAEDLTGYYNPLQRAYVTTPFLDALRAAEADPERLHIICLDEMNLARVEYYFADFLSAMEERSKDPVIDLYSDDEAGHVHTEFRLFVETILNAVPEDSFQNLGEFLSHKEVVRMLQDRLGVEDGESILQLHSRLRRMVAGVLNVPSRLHVAPRGRQHGRNNPLSVAENSGPIPCGSVPKPPQLLGSGRKGGRGGRSAANGRPHSCGGGPSRRLSRLRSHGERQGGGHAVRLGQGVSRTDRY